MKEQVCRHRLADHRAPAGDYRGAAGPATARTCRFAGATAAHAAPCSQYQPCRSKNTRCASTFPSRIRSSTRTSHSTEVPDPHFARGSRCRTRMKSRGGVVCCFVTDAPFATAALRGTAAFGPEVPGLDSGPVVRRDGAVFGAVARFDLEAVAAVFALVVFAFAFAFSFAFRAGAPARFPADRWLAAGDRREDPAFPDRDPSRVTGFLRGAAFFATFLTFATPSLRFGYVRCTCSAIIRYPDLLMVQRMSTHIQPDILLPSAEAHLPGAPELTALGKRIEMLRIQRGLSKQHLARHVGTSRQQLWRVMTGKSELSSPLRHRLTDVLGIDVVGAPEYSPLIGASATATAAAAEPLELQPWLGQQRRIEATLRSLPSGAQGRRLKRALLDLIEDIAAEQRIPITAGLVDLRRRVLNGEL